jgi:hypothetical protein
MFVIMFVLFMILLDIAAMLYGADSRDGIDSPEWGRRTTYWANMLNK